MPEDASSPGLSQPQSQSQSQSASQPASASSAAHSKPILTSATTSSASAAPPGHAIRRSFTVDETRKRPPLSHASSGESGFDGPRRRRSSNFTDYSLGEARDILNPKVSGGDGDFAPPESSSLASISLAFALLPAIAGAFFKNGGALVTDLMLLGLSGVFLHWSVTQPWNWYHAAQEVRTKHETSTEAAIDDDSDFEGLASSTHLDDVPEEDESKDSSSKKSAREPAMLSAEQRSALRELYIYEFLALVACFALPLLAAYLLHTIRAQLSRPSEGLVSNYNLTIFCLVSELRVFSHMFKLVQSRTLHLQRVVHKNPYGSAGSVDGGRMNQVLERLEKLEARTEQEEALEQKKSETEKTADKWKQEAAMMREVRNGIQPELDALNRAVRRYEKKATLLQMQTEARFGAVDARLEDAIALAAVAAKNSATQHKNVLAWLADRIVRALLFPFHAALQILLLPVKTVSGLIYRKSRGEPQVKAPRSRGSKVSGPGRYNGDRVPTRVGKR